MSLTDLPTEILFLIFDNLKGKDVVSCRKVCRRWRDIVDSFPDDKWKIFCENDFRDVHAAHKKAKLPWQELYKSLSLWTKIDSATLSAKEFPMGAVQKFQLLNNGIVAVCENCCNDIVSVIWGYSDTIVYYDLDTMQEINEEYLGFSFSSYKENDKMICVVDSSGRLCVIPKETKKKFFVGSISQNESCRREYSLFQSEALFQSDNGKICIAELKREDNGSISVESIELHDFHDIILAFHYVGPQHFFFLSDDRVGGSIYEFKDGLLSRISRILYYDNDMIYTLEKYGFDWAEPVILQWLFRTFDEEIMNITKLKMSSIHRCGNTILLSTYRRIINIYANAYTLNRQLKLYNARPSSIININKIFRDVAPLREVKQLGAVEIANGHKIIFLSDDMLFMIKLLHEDKDNNKNKRKPLAKTSTKNEQSKPPKRKDSHTTPKHKYATRSTTKLSK